MIISTLYIITLSIWAFEVNGSFIILSIASTITSTTASGLKTPNRASLAYCPSYIHPRT
eukprot:m.380957 g.380957  ORF g.380957 m.380957 type:complete len:59 (-) comp109476_c0_seq1:58-234(-)